MISTPGEHLLFGIPRVRWSFCFIKFYVCAGKVGENRNERIAKGSKAMRQEGLTYSLARNVLISYHDQQRRRGALVLGNPNLVQAEQFFTASKTSPHLPLLSFSGACFHHMQGSDVFYEFFSTPVSLAHMSYWLDLIDTTCSNNWFNSCRKCCFFFLF